MVKYFPSGAYICIGWRKQLYRIGEGNQAEGGNYKSV